MGEKIEDRQEFEDYILDFSNQSDDVLTILPQGEGCLALIEYESGRTYSRRIPPDQIDDLEKKIKKLQLIRERRRKRKAENHNLMQQDAMDEIEHSEEGS